MRFHKVNLNPRKQGGKNGQVSLELAASLVVLFILLFGTIQVFLWLNKRLVQRQQDYEANRVAAANSGSEVQVNETDQNKYPDLNIFGK